MKKVKNLPSALHAISIGQIIFDASEWVSIWGFMVHGGSSSRMDFILTFDQLNKLLRLSGEPGDKVQMLLVTELERYRASLNDGQQPVLVDLTEHFDGPVLFDTCRIEVSPTGIQDAGGQWRTDPNCLSIDEISPLIERAVPMLSVAAASRRNMEQCREVLIKLYELYLGYLEIGFDDDSALEKAELKDDLKFKMAYYSWQTRNAA